jgi:hypothetical protein
MLSRKQIWRRVSNRKKQYIDNDVSITKNKKKVNFDNIVSVTLIPSIKELNNQNLKHRIWWDDLDYVLFKKEYMEEIEYKKKYNTL